MISNRTRQRLYRPYRVFEVPIVKKFLPHAFATIVLCGILKPFIYYHYFHLNIIDYLTITELIFSFLKDFMPFVVIPFLAITLLYFSKIMRNRLDKSKRTFHDKKNQFIKFITLSKNLLLLIMNILTFGYFLCIMGNLSISSILVSLGIIIAMNISLHIALNIALRVKYNKIDHNIPSTHINLTLMLVGYILFCFLHAYSEIRKTTHTRQYSKTVLDFGNHETLTSGKDFYMIGKTEKYFVFYNKQSKSCTLFACDKIKAIYNQ